ncbi:Uncharacterised protein [Streptococcus pneumoniae]|nr:Uncharacterised protein [Streptococcus pneumoniae]
MNHTGSHNFDPTCFLTYVTAFSTTLEARNIHLNRWLCEWEVRWTQTNLTLFTKHFLDNQLKRSLKISHRDIFPNYQAFDLVELVTVGRIVRIATEDTPWRDHLQRTFRKIMGIHSTRLNWRRVGTEQDFFSDIESILHITSWVVFWKVHTFKVIVVLLHFKTIHDLITHTDEDIFDFFTGLCQNVTVTSRNWTTWKRHIDTLASQLSRDFLFFQELSCFFKSSCQDITSFIDVFPDDWTHLSRNIFHPFEDFSERTLFTKDRDTQILHLFFISSSNLLQASQRFFAKRF